MSESDGLAARFEEHRDRLRAVAYRILGSGNDADDAVQEAWLRCSRADTDAVEHLGSWLTAVVSRVCLNMLEARGSRPQPAPAPERAQPVALAAPVQAEPESEAVLADSVGLALLVVLDALRPAERVAFVLHDVFAIPFAEIAPILDRTTEATRKLASRARARVQEPPAALEADRRRQAALVDVFLAAARHGDFAALLTVLAPDVVLRADERAVELGAEAEARGAEAVAAFSRFARGGRRALLDGLAAAAWMPGGRLRAVWRFTTGGDRITAIDLIADPGRLRRLDLAIVDAL